MACLNLPLDDIIEAIKSHINTDDTGGVASVDGVATNITLKGNVLLDSSAKASLCKSLANCLNERSTSSFSLEGNNIVLKSFNGDKITLDRNALAQFLAEATSDLVTESEISDLKLLVDSVRANLTNLGGSITTLQNELASIPVEKFLSTATLVNKSLHLTLNSGEIKQVDMRPVIAGLASETQVNQLKTRLDAIVPEKHLKLLRIEGNQLVAELSDDTILRVDLPTGNSTPPLAESAVFVDVPMGSGDYVPSLDTLVNNTVFRFKQGSQSFKLPVVNDNNYTGRSFRFLNESNGSFRIRAKNSDATTISPTTLLNIPQYALVTMLYLGNNEWQLY